MSPKRRYQSSSLDFGIGLNSPPPPPPEYYTGGEWNNGSPGVGPITPAEIAVNPILTHRKIPPKTSPGGSDFSRLVLDDQQAPPNQPQRKSLSSAPAPAATTTTNSKGNRTYRIRHHHQTHYESPHNAEGSPSSNPSAGSLSQGLFGLPVLQDYLRSIRSTSPPPPQNRQRPIDEREWDFEELGDTKLVDVQPPDFHSYYYPKECPKQRMKTTLPTGSPVIPLPTKPGPATSPDEMDGILQIRPVSRSRTRPEPHTVGKGKAARRRVQSTSGLHQHHSHQQHQHQPSSGSRVSTALSSSQEHINDTNPSSVDTLLQDCLTKLKSSDWEAICNSFGKIQLATVEAPPQVRTVLKRIIWLGLPHFSSSRTKVSRAACQCFKKLYETQKRAMEGEGDKIFQKLLDLCGGPSNKFIQEESKAALVSAVHHTDGYKCLQLIERNGAKHRNANTREFAALLVGKIIDRVKVDRVMMSREYSEKVVPMIVGFLKEGQLNTRLNAKESLGKLCDHPEFNSVLHRCVSPENIRSVTDTLKKFRGRPRHLS